MLFVPLPLFATFVLVALSVRLASSRDLAQRPNRLFLALVLAYALQSLLFSLRWGYGVEQAAAPAALVAPVVPVLAYLAFGALRGIAVSRQRAALLAVPATWLVLAVLPELTDLAIILVYLAVGGLLVRAAVQGPDQFANTPLGNARDTLRAMVLTGGALIASGLTDIYVIAEFIRNGGQNVPMIVTVMQTGFILVIGGAAAVGRTSEQEDAPQVSPAPPAPSDEDRAILVRLDRLFAQEGLHRSEDLSLRRIARKLGLPDRRVSNAINRQSGMSVSQFVNDYRIKDACRLLETTDETVLAISLAAGFATKSNFNREFQRVTGLSPIKWRQGRPDDAAIRQV